MTEDRKGTPIYSGVLKYFPLAIAALARVSKAGNDKHNPGEPLHWSRGKSNDHLDCAARHLVEAGVIDPETGELHDANLAWRALANLQIAEEKRLAEPLKLPLAEMSWMPAPDLSTLHVDVTANFAEPPPPPQPPLVEPRPFFWYLATPYTRYPQGHAAAFREACMAAARLMLEGVPVFSPIAHSHPIAHHMLPDDKTDHKLWMAMDGPVMAAAGGLIIYELESWRSSAGMAEEIRRFETAGKPVVFWKPGEPVPNALAKTKVLW